MYKLIIDGIRNKLRKRGMNNNNTKNQELCAILLKYVKNKVLSVTSKHMNIK